MLIIPVKVCELCRKTKNRKCKIGRVEYEDVSVLVCEKCYAQLTLLSISEIDGREWTTSNMVRHWRVHTRIMGPFAKRTFTEFLWSMTMVLDDAERCSKE